MKVSFDGLRTNATRSMNNLHLVIYDIIENGFILDSEKEKITEAFNEASMFVDTFNCLESDDDDFNSMNDLSINRLEELENDNSI